MKTFARELITFALNLFVLGLNLLGVQPTRAADWVNTGTLTTARAAHTATLLTNGKVLVAGGEYYDGSNYVYLSSAELYDPVAGTWAVTAAMVNGRWYHTATLLLNGKVLVAGGYNNSSGYLHSAELYDPVTGTWTAAGDMTIGRAWHTATLLPDGKVLIAGGANLGPNPSTAELYDPATGMWTATGTMITGRSQATASLLPNGKVLVAGGYGNGALSSAELYDLSTGTWTATGPLTTVRELHTATLLHNGKVLVAGGVYYNGSGYVFLSSAELYDPATETWTATGVLTAGRYYHTATLLPDGKVLVAGGYGNGGSLASVELYNPTTETWGATSALTTDRFAHTAKLLRNGKVLVAGGVSNNGIRSGYLSSAELYTLEGDQPPVARCQDVAVAAGPDCMANASVDAGSYDPNNDPIAITQTPAGPYALGTTAVTLTVADDKGGTNTCTATVTVIDQTPPMIRCPAATVVDALNATGAPVTFTATATDNCGEPSVDCAPPSGSVFSIGATTVICTATDAALNTNSCSFTITVNGPLGIELEVLAQLQTWRRLVMNKEHAHKLGEAIDKLTGALNPALWVDETHLQGKWGEMVFQKDKEVVQKLEELIDKLMKKSDPLAQALQPLIDLKVRSARILAEVVLEDASGKNLKEGLKELAQGDTSKNAHDAIEHYKNAWKKATD